MMSQIIAPSHSYKNPRIYYSAKNQLSKKTFGIFYLANEASNDILELNPVPTRRIAVSKLKGANFFLEGEGAEGCHPLTLHNVEHIDQQRGARHYLLGNKDVKIMKNLTIILIGCMTLGLKLLAMFTLSMGSISIKCALLIYGWLPAHITLVMGVAIFLINIGGISKKYFGIIKSIHMHKFNSNGFKRLSKDKLGIRNVPVDVPNVPNVRDVIRDVIRSYLYSYPNLT